MGVPDTKPQEWVDAISALAALAPWALGLIAFIAVGRLVVVPLVRAWRGKD